MAEKGGKPGGERDKARRLAEALRQNLRRRKDQARARAGGARAEVAGAGNGRKPAGDKG